MSRRLLLLAFAAGCGTTITATMINPAPHPMRPRPPESVELFTSGPPQGRPYVDIAYLEAEQQTDLSVDDTAEFLGKLRVRAAAMGCDGVVVGGLTNRTTVAVLSNHDAASVKGITATCIAYSDASVAASPAPAR
ncbi:MAG: hypothetical protein ABI867_04500 [Kofleriaceae bacterium]